MSRLLKLSLAAAVFILIGGCQYVREMASSDLPAVTIDELASALQTGSVKVIDNNSEEVYRKNHIPTAVHMNSSKADASVLPADKSTPLVFYCKNKMCMASHAGARVALENGYTNVKVLPDGIDGWIKAGKPVESGGM